jgi:hypothetical protein
MVLVRPVSVILLGGLGLWWWGTTRSLLRSAGHLLPLVLIAGLMVGAWTVRNYARFGEVIPIATNGGYNFWLGSHRYANGTDMFWRSVPADDPEYRTMREGDEFTKNREGYRYGLAYLRARPDRFLSLIPDKVFWLYHTDTSGFYEGVLHPPMLGPSLAATWIAAHERLVESATFRYYQALLLLSGLGIILVPASGRKLLWPILALPLLLTGFHLFFYAKDRFHIPLNPFIALLAAVAITRLIDWAIVVGKRPTAASVPGRA